MNCKLGDLAIITRGLNFAGRIVEVVAHCPRNVRFQLPDGVWHIGCNYEWVVRFQNPIEAPTSDGNTRPTVFAPLPDRVLRPISGVPIAEEIEDEVMA